MFRKLQPQKGGRQRSRRTQLALAAALVLSAAILILYYGRQNEPNPATVAQPAKKKAPHAPTGSEPAKTAKNVPSVLATKQASQGVDRARSDQPAARQTLETAGVDAQTLVDRVVAALDDPSPEKRADAVESLEDTNDPAVNAALSKALADENPDVRDAAMEAMGEIASPNILDSLKEALTHGDYEMREDALDILEDILDDTADKNVIDSIIEFGLLNDNEDIRENAFELLDDITDQEFKSYQEARAWWDANRDTFFIDE